MKHVGLRVCCLSLFCTAFLVSCSSDPYLDYSVTQRPCTGYYMPEFAVEGKFYRCDDTVEVPNEKVGSFYAYMIDAIDEEKWREYDKDDSVIYIVDEHNGVITADSPDMNHRFKVYTIKDSVDLALDLKGWYIRCFYLGEV